MATMNRLNNINRECLKPAHLDERELGLYIVHSSTDKHKRGNCVIDVELQ